jgi:hypothetical protein
MDGKDTPLRRWRICQGLTQAEAGKQLGEKMRALGERADRARDYGHTAFSRFELGEVPPSWVLKGLKELTKLPYTALIEPEAYLAKHPQLYAEGQRPLQEGRGYPRGRPRKRPSQTHRRKSAMA